MMILDALSYAVSILTLCCFVAALLFGYIKTKPQLPPLPPVKYQIRIVTLIYGDDWADRLNAFYAGGWRLVTVIETSNYENEFYAILERPVLTTDTPL